LEREVFLRRVKDGREERERGQRGNRWHFVRCPTRPVEIGGELYLAAEEAIFGVVLVVS
jgi:hypothetical protein